MPTLSRASGLWAEKSAAERRTATEQRLERPPLGVIVWRVIFTAVLIGCIAFIFSNSMKIGAVSEGASGHAMSLLQRVLVRLGMPGIAQHLTQRIVRKLAHFCEFALEGFSLMLCVRAYTRRFVRYTCWAMLGGLLTALADETIQLYSPGRSSQVTDVWLDFAGILAGIIAAIVLLLLIRLCFFHRNKEYMQ